MTSIGDSEMEEFPGTLLIGRRNEKVYTEEQLEWLARVFPCHHSRRIADQMGCGLETLRKITRRMGLVKDKEYLVETQRKRWDKAERQRVAEQIAQLFVKDRRRVAMGLRQQTAYHVPDFNFSDKQYRCRYRMVKKGYILGDFKANGAERYTIYYDEQTRRSERVERYASNIGFTLKAL